MGTREVPQPVRGIWDAFSASIGTDRSADVLCERFDLVFQDGTGAG